MASNSISGEGSQIIMSREGDCTVAAINLGDPRSRNTQRASRKKTRKPWRRTRSGRAGRKAAGVGRGKRARPLQTGDALTPVGRHKPRLKPLCPVGAGRGLAADEGRRGHSERETTTAPLAGGDGSDQPRKGLNAPSGREGEHTTPPAE